jgi:glucose-1-phosphate thymidylyltransferase
MKCILLCAGYATRLFPITENFPKALLEIEEEKPLLNYIVDEVNKIKDIDEMYLVTNDRYSSHFENWVRGIKSVKPISILNDGTISNDDRLGAIGDIHYVIKQKKIEDDLLIICGDNLFEYNLNDMVDYFKQKKSVIISGKVLDDRNELKRFGVIVADENNKVTDLEEKPEDPKGNIVSFGIYIYPKESLRLIDQYLDEKRNPDAPGRLVTYIHKLFPTYVHKFQGAWYDVGTHESLDEVRKIYREKNN